MKLEEGAEVETFEKEDAGEAAFPCSSWGSQLPPATPSNSNLLFAWRPWEVAKPLKFKKRSPASQARSLRRLREWQEQRDLQRGQYTRECFRTPLPPPRQLRKVRLEDRLEGEKGGQFGSQTFPLTQWSGSQIPFVSASLSESQTVPCVPTQSGSQTASCSPPWPGSQTTSPSSPWSGSQGGVHQENWLSASSFTNQNVLQQSPSPLATLPSPIPWSSPPSLPGWTGPAGSCTWGTLPALVTLCPSCHAWGLMTPK